MKVTINVECTPEEARTFFGLPDVQPIQEAMMAEMQKRMENGMSGLDMENMMKMWMPGGATGNAMGGMPGLDQFQNMFWNAMNTATPSSTGKSKKSGKK